MENTKTLRPFGMRDKMGYLFGDFGNDFTFILSTMILMKFYTDVMGVSAGAVGVIMMLARVVDAFTDIAIVGSGVVYILFRSFGKYLGTLGSAKMVKCEPTVNKYLGITLLPQAGVALGMSITAMQLGADGTLVRNIVLFSVLVYELVGPMLTKMALQAAGEITPEGKKSSRGAADMAGGRRARHSHTKH